MNIRTVVFLLALLVSNFSYSFDFSGILDAGKGILDTSTVFVKRVVNLEEDDEETENRLRELMKPGVELQISQFTGLQPTNIEIDSISMTDFKGLTSHGIQRGQEATEFTSDDTSSRTRRAYVDFEIDLKLDCWFVFTLNERTANRIKIKGCKMVFEPDWSDVPKVDKDSIEEHMKPGIELQISQFTGLQPTSIEVTSVSATDMKGLATLGIQRLSELEWLDTSANDDSTDIKTAIVDFESGLKLGCLFMFILREHTPNRIKIRSCKMVFEPSGSDVPEVDEVSGGQTPDQ